MLQQIRSVFARLGELFPRGIFREPKHLPPYNDDFDYFCFIREYREPMIVLLLPTGDSYELEPRLLERYMKRYGYAEDYMMALLSYVWNFYTVWFDRESMIYQSIPREELVDEDTGRIKVPAFIEAYYRRA